MRLRRGDPSWLGAGHQVALFMYLEVIGRASESLNFDDSR